MTRGPINFGFRWVQSEDHAVTIAIPMGRQGADGVRWWQAMDVLFFRFKHCVVYKDLSRVTKGILHQIT